MSVKKYNLNGETDRYYEILLCPNGKYHDLLIPNIYEQLFGEIDKYLYTPFIMPNGKNIDKTRGISGCIAGT